MGASRLIVFLKAPRPGLVKTRLVGALGPDGACAAYVSLVETLLHRLRNRTDLELRFTPDDAAGEVRPWVRPGWVLEPQGRGDLGARLARATEAAFSGGCGPVVIIGADCPEVSSRDVEKAVELLTEGKADVVLGPARDGGYWLIAMRKPWTALFSGIPWSTDRVLIETTARAQSLHLAVKELRTLTDVDEPEDWETIRPRLGDLWRSG
jgi:rSAM/selenodomain-associated transferase 1